MPMYGGPPALYRDGLPMNELFYISEFVSACWLFKKKTRSMPSYNTILVVVSFHIKGLIF